MKPYTESQHIVLDIETLGVETGAPIIQIAAQALWLNKETKTPVVSDMFSRYINLRSNADLGLTKFEPATLIWWLNQSKKSLVAEDVLRQTFGGDDWDDVILGFWTWVNSLGLDWDNTYYWSRGSDFDFRHLNNVFEKTNTMIPWEFWQIRDIRTIDDPLFLKNYQRRLNNHNAQTDVENEIDMLSWALFGQHPRVDK